MAPEQDSKHLSLASQFAAKMSPKERGELYASLTEEELRDTLEDWRFWGRPNQFAPGPDCEGCKGRWLNWILLSGRGFGKTRTGAEWVHENVNNGTYGLFHLIGATAADVRDIMVEGESGILATAKRRNPVHYITTKRKLEWANGAKAILFSADEPERLRGPQCEAAWADELCAWRYDQEAWKQLQLGLRLGPFPRSVITTTPKPSVLLKRLVKDVRNHITVGSTYDNIGNLSEVFINEVVNALEGTRWGRQEIYAEILDDAETALWTRDLLESTRVSKEDFWPDPNEIHATNPALTRIVIGVDPAMSFNNEAAETGIVVCGLSRTGHAYVLQDASGKYKPEGWAAKVVALYDEWQADKIIAEKNQGGELVKYTIEVQDPNVPVKVVWASKNKIPRAEPISTAYERGRVHHVGNFPTLEDQMCQWELGNPDSPDRMDAMVWAMTELIGKQVTLTLPTFINNDLAGESYWRSI